MKNRLICSLILILAVFGLTATGSAQNLKIGVVDMQECLNKYYKTAQEVEKIKKLVAEKQSLIDARKADYEALTRRATELDKVAADESLGVEPRQQAANELRGVLQERVAKGREISQAEGDSRQETLMARQKMEQALVEELREVVEAKAAEAGLDLVFDKSFLPKANKVILVTTANVPDLTAAIIAKLNADAPAGATTTAPPATGATPLPPAPAPTNN